MKVSACSWATQSVLLAQGASSSYSMQSPVPSSQVRLGQVRLEYLLKANAVVFVLCCSQLEGLLTTQSVGGKHAVGRSAGASNDDLQRKLFLKVLNSKVEEIFCRNAASTQAIDPGDLFTGFFCSSEKPQKKIFSFSGPTTQKKTSLFSFCSQS